MGFRIDLSILSTRSSRVRAGGAAEAAGGAGPSHEHEHEPLPAAPPAGPTTPTRQAGEGRTTPMQQGGAQSPRYQYQGLHPANTNTVMNTTEGLHPVNTNNAMHATAHKDGRNTVAVGVQDGAATATATVPQAVV